jgi:2-alkyl-3-oxoalkanoate reductase
VALRYEGFYGTAGSFVDQVRRRRVPLVGNGGGIWSFIHINDVASANRAALTTDHVGTFNVVDDDPAPVREWLPELARAIGARRPFRLPLVVARLLLPKHLIVMGRRTPSSSAPCVAAWLRVMAGGIPGRVRVISPVRPVRAGWRLELPC